jgi:hypothetical protein
VRQRAHFRQQFRRGNATIIQNDALQATLLQMVEAMYLPWAEQMGRVFEYSYSSSCSSLSEASMRLKISGSP